MNNTLFLGLFFLLLLTSMTIPSVLAEGFGEVNRTSNNSLSVSWDEERRQTQSEFAYNEEDFPIYFWETDRYMGVSEYAIVGRTIHIMTYPNPNLISVRPPEENIYFCYTEQVRLPIRPTISNGERCPEDFYEYNMGTIRYNTRWTYEMPIRSSLSDRYDSENIIPFLWFIGEGAGGGGGCLCDPAIYNVFLSISSVLNPNELNSQDGVDISVDWVGGSTGCFGSYIQILKRYDGGSWSTVQGGTSSNYGTEIVDSNGVSPRVLNPADDVSYTKQIDFQILEDDVDFSNQLICAGSWWHETTSGIAHSSITETTPPYMTWHTPTPNNETTDTSPLLNGTPTDNNEPLRAFWEFDNDILGYWTMDHYNTTTVYDNSSYNNELTLNTITSADWDNGISGLAPDFPLAHSYLNLDTPITITENMSFSLWYYLESATGSYKMMIGDATSNGHLGVWYDNRLRFKETDTTYWDFAGEGRIGEWTHLVITNDGTNWTFYNNGEKFANRTQSGVFNITRIGHAYSTTSYSWNGDIDEVIIFNRTLTAEEVQNLYNSTYDNIQKQYNNLSTDTTHNYTVWLQDIGGNEVKVDRWFRIIEETIEGITHTPSIIDFLENKNNYFAFIVLLMSLSFLAVGIKKENSFAILLSGVLMVVVASTFQINNPVLEVGNTEIIQYTLVNGTITNDYTTTIKHYSSIGLQQGFQVFFWIISLAILFKGVFGMTSGKGEEKNE